MIPRASDGLLAAQLDHGVAVAGNAAPLLVQERVTARVGKSTPTSNLAKIAEDPDVFEAFYREHVEAVQRFIGRRMQDPYRAADLTGQGEQRGHVHARHSRRAGSGCDGS
jgi:hypothetical protein